jgi:alkanesulfonate monooxygenase SsuD/methylene tetrahydromethanopterin reductase-like flavin-dependent oxidoreductase (luciferase family)
MYPKPVQKPHPPIWVGGHTEPALRRTALLGDAWHPIGLRGPAGLAPDELAEKVARLRTLAREAGRDPARIGVALRAPLDLAPARGAAPAAAARPLAGPPAKVLADLRAYQAAGVDTFVFDFPRQEPAAMLALMRRVAREIRPRLGRGARRAGAAGRR